jgi:DME family drug/metabolite transporter
MAFHAVAQGLVAGVGAVLAFGYAIGRLGVQRASASIALVPVCAALMGWGLLGERLGPLDWAAVVAASLGVAAANGAFSRWTGPHR